MNVTAIVDTEIRHYDTDIDSFSFWELLLEITPCGELMKGDRVDYAMVGRHRELKITPYSEVRPSLTLKWDVDEQTRDYYPDSTVWSFLECRGLVT